MGLLAALAWFVRLVCSARQAGWLAGFVPPPDPAVELFLDMFGFTPSLLGCCVKLRLLNLLWLGLFPMLLIWLAKACAPP